MKREISLIVQESSEESIICSKDRAPDCNISVQQEYRKKMRMWFGTAKVAAGDSDI